MSLFCVPTGVMGTLSSELSVRFGLRGSSHVVTTGCTSSTDAFGYSLRQIQSGRLDMVLSGGADAPIALGIVKGFILMKILTDSWNDQPERGSRPFSGNRDGFVVAEGAWMFILEEYEHAHARGARILAEVRGYGSTCEAFHRVRLQECGEEPARAIQNADVRGRHRTGQRGLRKFTWHIHPTERSHRNPGFEIGARRTRATGTDVSSEISDRASPGRLRRRRGGCDHRRHEERENSSDHQPGQSRPETVTWTMSPMPGVHKKSSTRFAIASPSAQRTRLLC